jgi:hypothetical protein
MSGPIVRKYGFPNYEAIFGKKEIEHGVEDAGAAAEGDAPKLKKPAAGAKKAAPKKGKKSAE